MPPTDPNGNLQGQAGQPQPGTINPASAQGGQGESQPSMTQTDPTKTAGSTGTQMDPQGRPLGARNADAGERPDTKPSESQP